MAHFAIRDLGTASKDTGRSVSHPGVAERDEMRKALVTASVLVVVVVIAYLAFNLMRPRVAPCETIFQQTSLKLSTSLNLVRSKGPEVSIEEQKIQDLTERSQMSALNLKTCC